MYLLGRKDFFSDFLDTLREAEFKKFKMLDENNLFRVVFWNLFVEDSVFVCLLSRLMRLKQKKIRLEHVGIGFSYVWRSRSELVSFDWALLFPT